MAEKFGVAAVAEESSNSRVPHHTTAKLVVLADLNVDPPEADDDDSSLVPPPSIAT